MVEIFDDRVDIVNLGGVCKGINRDNFGSISLTRNSIIASMLHRVGYIEQMGTGIMRIKNAAKEANITEPEFELEGFFKVSFIRNAYQPIKTSDGQAIDKRLTSDGDTKETSEKKQFILNYLEIQKKVTVSDVSGIIKLSKPRIRAILQEMSNEGTIEKIGNNRYAYYVLKKNIGLFHTFILTT